VEDKAGDLGASGASPFWLSPDVDIPATPGLAVQGSNTVQIRVHAHEEPILDEKVVAEVYVGRPSLAMSPTTGTIRIDPGNLLFRPPGVAGTEPILTEPGATLTFPWTPSNTAADINGPGHRCLIVRAFPQSVTPPTSAFDVPNEPHEAQHNIDIIATSMDRARKEQGGAGTKDDPRKRDPKTGIWSERFDTVGTGGRGRRFVVWAIDPEPDEQIHRAINRAIGRRRLAGFSTEPPDTLIVETVKARGKQVDPRDLLRSPFGRAAGLGRGVFGRGRLVAAASMILGPRTLSSVILRFDHSNLAPRTAVVLHGAQWREDGTPEGGITLVALAPVKP
jgi:hypothetical protein